MKKPVFILTAALLALAGAPMAGAEMVAAKAALRTAAPQPQQPQQKCVMQGNSTVNVNFNGVEKDILLMKSALDEKIRTIKALAKEMGLQEIEIQSMNYSANMNNSGGGCNNPSAESAFQTYANISFTVKPADKAAAFTAALVKKGYNASLNVNMYRNCGYVNPGDVVEGDGD